MTPWTLLNSKPWGTRTRWRISPNPTLTGPTTPRGLCSSSTLVRSVPNITFSVQNCNSLNISTDCDKQLAKLIAITALCTDIIFLCDTRLKNDSSSIDKISKVFLCNNNRNYYLHYNSAHNKRGVGILITCDLPCSITHNFTDIESNILGLLLEMDKYIFAIFAVYGPNDNDKTFFSNLAKFVTDLGDVPVIMGGDWNATYSQLPAQSNIDIVNMQSPPSLIRSGWLTDLCASLNLLDPFRGFHPTSRDFTYFPKGARKNRSRIDFFLFLKLCCKIVNLATYHRGCLFLTLITNLFSRFFKRQS